MCFSGFDLRDEKRGAVKGRAWRRASTRVVLGHATPMLAALAWQIYESNGKENWCLRINIHMLYHLKGLVYYFRKHKYFFKKPDIRFVK